MRHCFVVRVFTRGDDGGNHLGIVTDVTGLTDGTMQAIATELGFSETIFVDSMDGEVPHVRIFTPTIELPFAGHPLVGAAWLLNALAPEAHSTLTCGIGTVGLAWDGDRAWIEVRLDQAVRSHPGFDGRGLGLGSVVSASFVDMPLSYVVAELADPAEVAAYVPVGARLGEHPDGQHLSIWAWIDAGTIQTRFFAPKMGILEDPATGSAAVAIAAVLNDRGDAHGAVTLLQGAEMGSPSEIALDWSDGMARLGGAVVRDEVRELVI